MISKKINLSDKNQKILIKVYSQKYIKSKVFKYLLEIKLKHYQISLIIKKLTIQRNKLLSFTYHS